MQEIKQTESQTSDFSEIYISDTSLMELVVESQESPICKINMGKSKCGQLPSTPGLIHNVVMCIRIKLNKGCKSHGSS